MRRWGILMLVLAAVAAAATATLAVDQQSGTLDAAIAALGADHINSIEYTGFGSGISSGRSPIRTFRLRNLT